MRGGKWDGNSRYTVGQITVSGDGSWAKRGFTSLLGIASLIGKHTNKIVDVVVKSKVCKACEQWSRKFVEFLEWYEDHKDDCAENHEGTSRKMEVDGVIEIFKRSVEKFGIKYKSYIGNGDSKTFTNLLDADPYDGNPVVEKKECVLHIKKRMYRRVKEARKAHTLFLKAKNNLKDLKKNRKIEFCTQTYFRRQKDIGDSIIHCCRMFNEGFMPVLKIMKAIGVKIDPKFMQDVQIFNRQRISKAVKVTSDASKKARLNRRGEKVEKNGAYEEERLFYVPGIAN